MSLSLTKEQSHLIASAIRPLIKSFVKANQDDFETWLKSEKEKNKDCCDERK